MARFWQSLRTGGWLTPDRARGYCLSVLAIASAAIIVWVALADRLVDRNGKPLGTDFSSVYAAGVLTLSGKAADAYDPALQHAAEKMVFGGRDVPFFGWHYPPFFFAVAALVATIPYAWGLLTWLACSGLAYLLTLRGILPELGPMKRAAYLAAIAFPAVFINIGHGQNGFLTAALLGAGLNLLEKRPALAGVLIGLLAYKPQFGILIPLALIADRRWTAITTAATTIVALVAATFVIFGNSIWLAFAASTAFTQHVVLEQGTTGWEKIQSIFSAVRMWGAGIPAAYVIQCALTLTLAASLIWLWRSKAAYELKASALATACLLATPYVLDYDLMVLSIAIAFFVRHGLAEGFHDFEISLLAAAWLTPLIARGVASATEIPLGFVVVAAFYAFTLRRAMTDTSDAAASTNVLFS